MPNFLRHMAAICSLLAAMSQADIAQADPLSVTGEVTYRERITLPQGSSLTVSLVDLGRPKGSTGIKAEARLSTRGQVPFTFTLSFDDALIAPGHDYGLVAEISGGGGLLFRNAEPLRIDPLAPSGKVVMLVGFVGLRNPTEPEQLVDRPETLRPMMPEKDRPSLYIMGRTWRATMLDGKALDRGVGITLAFAEDGRTSGRSSCNSYFAEVRFDGESLDFGAIAATRKTCGAGALQIERRYFSALGRVKSFSKSNERLDLLDENGVAIVSFASSR